MDSFFSGRGTRAALLRSKGTLVHEGSHRESGLLLIPMLPFKGLRSWVVLAAGLHEGKFHLLI